MWHCAHIFESPNAIQCNPGHFEHREDHKWPNKFSKISFKAVLIMEVAEGALASSRLESSHKNGNNYLNLKRRSKLCVRIK